MANRRWDLLPGDLLRSVVSRLRADDFVRACSVSREWRLVLLKEPQLLSPAQEFPWLLLPSLRVGELPSSCSFLRIPDRRRFHLPYLPEISGRRCVGSKDGWLVTLDLISLQPRILNPLTRAELPLPFLPTEAPGDEVRIRRRPDGSIYEFWYTRFANHEGNPPSKFPDLYVKKIALSTVPTGVTAVICGCVGINIIALAKPGDDRWSAVPDTPLDDYFEDVVYREDDGRFYAVTGHASVLAFNVDGSMISIVAPGRRLAAVGDIPSHDRYVVCSSGILLQVWRISRCFFLPCGAHREMTVGFHVYKINPDGENNRTCGVPLKDLGDQCLFLGGRCSSVSVRAAGNLGLKKNCIFFTEDFPDTMFYAGKSEMATPFMNVGWYDFVEGKLGCYYPLLLDHVSSDWPAPIWFWPSLI
ncbi:putative F-box protein [Apostasia shenzhenica]|uniref:Putative F-box protein n=1 Tax=Apostasia shenzhenica TaxID=1088818 RepID=A0A2I0ACE7_9ASPA|nr:putative F-box protein [Apostasia shenzhenica]